MNKPLIFTVHGTPRPQPRPRFVKGRVVSTASKGAKLWRLAVERSVRQAIADSGRVAPLFSGAVRLVCTFTFEPPSGAQSRIGQPHIQKPDASNLLKLVEDVMETAGVFGNDCQVSRPDVAKWWGERASLTVLVEDASTERRAPSAASAVPPDWLRAGLGL